jgi:hypothetical protein
MGVSYNVYIGPYIEVSGKKEKITIKVDRLCVKHPGIKQEKNKFCSECGSEIIGVDREERKTLTPAEYFYKNDNGEMSDRIWSPEGMNDVFISNRRVPGSIRINTYDDGFFTIHDLSDANHIMSTQKSWFFQEHKEEITLLTKMFGEENISVKWGVVSYYS